MGNGLVSCCKPNVVPNEFVIDGDGGKEMGTHGDQSFLNSSVIGKLDTNLDHFENTPCLTLKILNSTTLNKGSEITITKTGLRGGLRNVDDGTAYFGCKKYDSYRKIVNDYIIPSGDPEKDAENRGQHFKIEYSERKKAFLLRDLSIGYGTFVKLQSAVRLQDNSLLNMGESFIVVYLLQSKSIQLKVFGGPSSGEVFTLQPTNACLYIGRHNSCEIQIEDSVLSKHQATLFYRQKKGWMIQDGHREDRVASTNGTWMYINDDWIIAEGMLFKANATLFEASLSN